MGGISDLERASSSLDIAKYFLIVPLFVGLGLLLVASPQAIASAQDPETPTSTLVPSESLTPESSATSAETETLPVSATPTSDFSVTSTETPSETPTGSPTETLTSTPTSVLTETATAMATPTADCASLGPEYAALCAEIEENGSVRVMVELDVDVEPLEDLNALQEAAQESEIAEAQEAVAEELEALSETEPEVVAEVIRELETVPYMSVEVDQAGLMELVQSDEVEDVFVERRSAPALETSTEIIGADVAWSLGYTGANTTIAILDTGVDSTHPFFEGRVISEACYSSDTSWPSWSLCSGGAESSTLAGSGTNCPVEIYGCDHGTHVAGIAAGDGPSFNGVAPDANIISVQVFSRFHGEEDCGDDVSCIYAWDSDVIAGLERVYDLRNSVPNLAVVNLSVGGGLYSGACNNEPIKAIIDNLYSAGVISVAAAGNEGSWTRIGWPACITTTFAVAASTDNDTVAAFTNNNTYVDYFAPGVGILSSVPGGGYAGKSGTSMAAAHLTGALAILKEAAVESGSAYTHGIVMSLPNNGVTINDPRGGGAHPRIQIDRALESYGLGLFIAANDDRSAALDITEYPFWREQSNKHATIEVDEQALYTCGPGDLTKSVWYTFQPVDSGQFVLEAFSGSVNTVIHVFDSSMQLQVCHDDPADKDSQVIINANAGELYYISIADAIDINQVTFQFVLSLKAVNVSNDSWENPVLIDTAEFSYDQFTGGATVHFRDGELEECFANQGRASVWFKYVASLSGRVRASTLGSDYDTVLAAWRVSSTFNPARLEDETIACNDDIDRDNDITASEVVVDVSAGRTYYFEVTMWDGPYGFSSTEAVKPQEANPVYGGNLHFEFEFWQRIYAPEPLFPNWYAVISDNTPTFTWNGRGPGTWYEIEVDDQVNFPSPLFRLYHGSAATQFTVPDENTIPDGTWYWRVRGGNDHGMTSEWGSATLFTVDTPGTPALSSPANGHRSVGAVELKWLAEPGALQYQLQVGLVGGNFAAPVYDSGSIAVLKTTPSLTQVGNYEWRVRADLGGVWSNWSPLRSFELVAPLPLAPALSAPANGSLTMDNTPEFAWAAVNWADHYEIQLARNNKFTTGLVTVVGDPGELAHTATALADGLYYWRVRAWNINSPSQAGAWSATRKFTVDTTPPNAVALIAPAAASSITTNVPRFQWASVSTAVLYELQVDNDADFSSPNAGPVVPQLFYQFGAPEALDFQVYYWRVRAQDVAGNWGAWTPPRDFTVSLLTFPKPGTFTTDHTPLLQWAVGAGVLEYKVQVDDNSDFSSPEIDESPMAARLNLDETADGRWYWRLAVRYSSGWTQWSQSWDFTVTPAPPAAAVLLLPAANAVTSDSTPDLSWNSVPGAHTYQVQVSRNKTFTSIEQESTIGLTTTHTVSDLTDGIHYWRVRAINIFGYVGAWSTMRAFTTDTTGPSAPVPKGPAANVTVRGVPTFSWKAASTATQYQFQLDEVGGDFTSPVFTISNLTSLSYYPATFFDVGSFDWRVSARDAYGNWGGWSPPRGITINLPVPLAPALYSPAKDALTSDPTVQLNFGAAAYAASYEVQLAHNSAFTSGPQLLSNFVSGTQTSTLADGLYYWRVRSVNAANQAGAWSGTRTFTVDLAPPADPTFTSPADNSSSVGAPLFSWAKVAGAASYQLQIDEDGGGFSSPLYESAWISATSLRLPTTFAEMGSLDWRVRSKDLAGNISDGAAFRSLLINPPTTAAPTLLLPLQKSTSSDSIVLLTWTNAAYAEHSEVWIDTDSKFALPHTEEHIGATGETTFETSTLLDGVYIWKVRSYNILGQPGVWSAVRSFTIDTIAPATAPASSSPADNLVSRAAPLHRWVTVSGATQYQIEYYEDGTNTPVFTSPWITGLTYTPPFSTLGNYDWSIRARDAAMNEGPWSAPRNLQIIPLIPTAPILSLPAASAKTNDNTPAFTWQATSSGITYQIQIDNASNFATPEVSQLLGTGILTYTPAVLPDGNYYWRVRAMNINGEPGPWAVARVLYIGNYP